MLEPRHDTPEDLARRLDAMGQSLRASETMSPPPALAALVAARAHERFVRISSIIGVAAITSVVLIYLARAHLFSSLPAAPVRDRIQEIPTINLLRRMNPGASADAIRLPAPVSGGSPNAPRPRDAGDPAKVLDDTAPGRK